MDDNSYRRVMSRNLDEFGLNQGNKSTNISSSQASSIGNNYSSRYSDYNSGYNVTTNRACHGAGTSYNTSGNTNYYSRSTSNDYSSDYGRKKNNINLKQIKAVGLSCAKNLTNKLINLSNQVAGTSHSTSSSRSYTTQNMYSSTPSNNKYSCSSKDVYVVNSSGNRSGYSADTSGYASNTSGYGNTRSEYGASSYIHSQANYGTSSSAHGTSVVDNRIYTLKCIADRIATTSDLIKTHRELVAVIERCLTHSDYMVEITIEKDRFGAPTLESINKFSLINKVLVEKILTYIKGRRDCCIFVVKFATWRMRTTKKPEEVILSLELLGKCMNEMGGYFLGLFTRSLMKTLRKLLFATNLKHSITSGVKKKITKFLGKTSYVHPGVSTDIRIHIFKSKIMYMVQLYYEVFLFEQGEYVVFYDGYKDMRIRGIKFPTINPEDKNQINKSYTFSSFNSTNPTGNASNTSYSSPSVSYGTVVGTPGYRVVSINLGSPVEIDVRELDQLLQNINNNNYDAQYIQNVRQKLLGTIEALSSRSNLSDHYSQLLDKILKLNDSLLMLCNTEADISIDIGTVPGGGIGIGIGNASFTATPVGFTSVLGGDTTGYGSSDKDGTSTLGGWNSDSILGGMSSTTGNNKSGDKAQGPFDNLLEFGETSVTSPKDDFDFFNYSSANTLGSSSLSGFDTDSGATTSGLPQGSNVGTTTTSKLPSSPAKEDIKENLDDIFNFISLNANENKEETLGPKDDSDDEDEQFFEDEDELINNFINSPASFGVLDINMSLGDTDSGTGDLRNRNSFSSVGISSVTSNIQPGLDSTSVDNKLVIDTTSNTIGVSSGSVSSSGLETAKSPVSTPVLDEPISMPSSLNSSDVNALVGVDGSNKDVKSESVEAESENKDGKEKEEDSGNKEGGEKNLSQLVSELDNLEVDFGHMSVNNF